MPAVHSTPVVRRAVGGCTLLAGLAAGGCSVMTPEPVWELAKATAGVASLAVSAAPSQSRDTLRHFGGALDAVCIRYNPDAPVEDIVPALQAELRSHRVDSRVYDRSMPAATCGVWLRYEAQIDWEQPPFQRRWQPYLRQAALALRAADGQLLSISHYRLDGAFGAGKWTSTRDKLAPVVTALLTGVDSASAGRAASPGAAVDAGPLAP